jgi:hypothetical protein
MASSGRLPVCVRSKKESKQLRENAVRLGKARKQAVELMIAKVKADINVAKGAGKSSVQASGSAQC